ncbi:MAG TPA: DUF5676 family membrane protein [Pyrinomonadaceae bacterium]
MASNIRALTITGAVMAAVTYVICAAFVALAPGVATSLGSDITHIDLSTVGRAVTWGGAVRGIVFFTVFIALVCAASGWLYNRLTRAADVGH